MNIIKNIKEMQNFSEKARLAGKKIAFVPTMGYLHEGHLSLLKVAKKHGDLLVVSIFVNPSQFAPNEDFNTYPRNFQRDFGLLEKENTDIVFTPDAEAIYPEGFQTYVNLEKLPKYLCGISRPTFFRGVATIVTKLFNIVKPHTAVFGKKDYQQLAVIRRMVADLNMDIDIVGAETVRETDGLAMSSRNTYLNDVQRKSGLSLNKALIEAQKAVESEITDAARIIEQAENFIRSYPETQIDYVAVCDPDTLENVLTVDRPVLMALAVKVGTTRLIDNRIIYIK